MEMSSASKNSEYKWGCFACLATYMSYIIVQRVYCVRWCRLNVGASMENCMGKWKFYVSHENVYNIWIEGIAQT